MSLTLPLLLTFTIFLSQALEHYGGIDILVSNAAVNPFFGKLLDVTEEVWDKVRKESWIDGWIDR